MGRERKGKQRKAKGRGLGGYVSAEGDSDVLTTRFYDRGMALRKDEGQGRDLGVGSMLYVVSG